jgi:hypothetical protein
LDGKLENAQADQRADLARRFGTFEQADRRFKDWVQKEHEHLYSRLEQVRVATQQGLQQQQQKASDLAQECQQTQRHS